LLDNAHKERPLEGAPVTKPIAKRSIRARLTRHKRVVSGIRRVEVVVLKHDEALLRQIAQTLRAGGRAAALLRDDLLQLVQPDAIRTGAELVAFFQSSPLAGVNLDLERNRPPTAL
jgi:hypothetical protein